MDRKTPSRFGFAVLEMTFWCAYGSFVAYFVPYITIERGISAGTAGALLSLFMICACFGQMLVSSICDRFKNNKQVFITAMALICLLYYLLYFTHSVALLFVFIALLGLIQIPASSAMDTWLLRSYPGHQEYYGPLRAMGSLGYAVLVLGLGFLINSVGYGVMLVFGTAFITVAIITALIIPGVPVTGETVREEGQRTGLRAMPHIVWFMIAAMLLVGMGNSPILQLQSLLIRGVGGNITLIGVAVSVNAFCEFPTMCLAQYTMHIRASTRLLMASIGYFLSTTVMIFARTPLLLILMLAVNGVCMGVLTVARRQLVCENVPVSLQNRAHALGDAAYISFGGFFGNLMGGYVIQYVSTTVMLTVCAAVHAFAVAASAVLLGKHKALVGDKQKIAYAPPEEKEIANSELR